MILGHSRKHPSRRKLEVNSPTLFGCPNVLSIITPPSGRYKCRPWGGGGDCGSFLERPIGQTRMNCYDLPLSNFTDPLITQLISFWILTLGFDVHCIALRLEYFNLSILYLTVNICHSVGNINISLLIICCYTIKRLHE